LDNNNNNNNNNNSYEMIQMMKTGHRALPV